MPPRPPVRRRRECRPPQVPYLSSLPSYLVDINGKWPSQWYRHVPLGISVGSFPPSPVSPVSPSDVQAHRDINIGPNRKH